MDCALSPFFALREKSKAPSALRQRTWKGAPDYLIVGPADDARLPNPKGQDRVLMRKKILASVINDEIVERTESEEVESPLRLHEK